MRQPQRSFWNPYWEYGADSEFVNKEGYGVSSAPQNAPLSLMLVNPPFATIR
jgi:hypothetical protein